VSEVEQSFTYAQFRQAFARKFQLVAGKRVGQPVVLSTDSAGTHFFWEAADGTRNYGVISDLAWGTAAETLGADGLATTLLARNERAFLYVLAGTTWSRVTNIAALDALGASQRGIPVMTLPEIYNGATFDRLRTPNVFKTADASAAGNTTVWTPAAGKKFRLMKLLLSIDGTATLAVAGSELITFNDSGTAIGVGFRVALAAAAVTSDTDVVIPYDMGNGYLSSAADNLLQINLGTALNAGNIRVSVMGTEE